MSGNQQTTATQDMLRERARSMQIPELDQAADEFARLQARVIYLEWSMEMAADNIERGRGYDALHGLRAPLRGVSPHEHEADGYGCCRGCGKRVECQRCRNPYDEDRDAFGVCAECLPEALVYGRSDR